MVAGTDEPLLISPDTPSPIFYSLTLKIYPKPDTKPSAPEMPKALAQILPTESRVTYATPTLQVDELRL